MSNAAKDDNLRILPQYVAAMSAAGGAFAMGTLLGWSSPVQDTLMAGSQGFALSEDEFSWVGSTVTLGAACVCLPTGFICNLIGRKGTMLCLLIPFTIGWCLLIWAQNLAMMYAARLILGIAGGAFCVAAPMYTGEISHKTIRGTLGSFYQLMVTVGILFVYLIGAVLDVFWLSIVCGAFPILNAIIFAFMPESPTYLTSKNKTERANRSMKWLRGANYNFQAEIEELNATDAQIKQNPVSITAALKRGTALKALGITLALMVFQQLSGVNAFIFYSANIFEDAKTGINADVATIVVGAMMVLATLTSALVVDKLGRRLLLFASCTVASLATICMGIYFYMQERDPESVATLGWLPLCSLCVFIIMFSLGLGPVPFVIMGELFTTETKGAASSIAGTTNWMTAFVVTKTYVNLKSALGNGETFWLFAAISMLGAVFVYFFVPETKGKSLNEIQELLEGGK